MIINRVDAKNYYKFEIGVGRLHIFQENSASSFFTWREFTACQNSRGENERERTRNVYVYR